MYQLHRYIPFKAKSKKLFGVIAFCIYIGLVLSLLLVNKRKYIKVIERSISPLKLHDLSAREMSVIGKGGSAVQTIQQCTTSLPVQPVIKSQGQNEVTSEIPRILHQTWQTTFIPK